MAKKFWTYLETKKYNIGLTSRTVYIYDKNGNEQAKFKDLSYAYSGCVSPNEQLLVIKSTEGRMAIYSLEKLELIKKFRFSKVDGAQDDNFIFSPDGKYLYNIERHGTSCKTALSVYDTSNFSLQKRLFDDDENLVLTMIEYDTQSNNYSVLGFMRDPQKEGESKSFSATLKDDKLEDIEYIDERTHLFLSIAKEVQSSGYTDKTCEWLFNLKKL